MFDRQVRTNTTQAPEKAPAGSKPNTILNAVPITMTAIQYVDAEENLHSVVVVTAGNQHYVPKDAEQWLRELRPLKEELKVAFNARSASKDAVPKKDTVDVV